MSANIKIIVQEKKGALLLPFTAVQNRNGKTFVRQKSDDTEKGRRYTRVETGLQDGSNIEILDGLTESSLVLIPDTTFVIPKNKAGGNPFSPQQPRRSKP